MDFILQYWVEFLLGIIAAGLIAFSKKIYTYYCNDKQNQISQNNDIIIRKITDEMTNIINQNRTESLNGDQIIQKQVNDVKDNLAILKSGILSIQGKDFKNDCRRLLQSDYVITQEDWELINYEYEIYHNLGGNHDGDRLYNDVKTKYRNNL